MVVVPRVTRNLHLPGPPRTSRPSSKVDAVAVGSRDCALRGGQPGAVSDLWPSDQSVAGTKMDKVCQFRRSGKVEDHPMVTKSPNYGHDILFISDHG